MYILIPIVSLLLAAGIEYGAVRFLNTPTHISYANCILNIFVASLIGGLLKDLSPYLAIAADLAILYYLILKQSKAAHIYVAAITVATVVALIGLLYAGSALSIGGSGLGAPSKIFNIQSQKSAALNTGSVVDVVAEKLKAGSIEFKENDETQSFADYSDFPKNLAATNVKMTDFVPQGIRFLPILRVTEFTDPKAADSFIKYNLAKSNANYIIEAIDMKDPLSAVTIIYTSKVEAEAMKIKDALRK